MNVLRMTGRQHAQLQRHLYPGDGDEAVAVLLCGRQRSGDHETLLVHRIIEIPHAACRVRTPVQLVWPTELLIERLPEVAERGWAVVKIHSHPGGYARFSAQDDVADLELFEAIEVRVDDGKAHGSAVMLPDGQVFARLVQDGCFTPIDLVAVAGQDLAFWFADGVGAGVANAADVKNAQAFGPGTVNVLKRLRVAVVGCSGTGSPLVEMLARLGVGTLVLVDPDAIEEKNLNRIVNGTLADARAMAPKVQVLARAIDSMGLGTQVIPIQAELATVPAVQAVASCDLAFGCVDSIDGRYMLNRLAACYLLPYLDVGVKLEADGRGGVDEIVGSVHYLQPDRSSLMTRGVFTAEELRTANLLRTDPAEHARQAKEGYVAGATVERPAVVSVNMAFASMAVNELLARIHGYRLDANDEFAVQCMSLTKMATYRVSEHDAGPPCRGLAALVGRGDMSPFLNMPELSA